jgi:hypothetical protein
MAGYVEKIAIPEVLQYSNMFAVSQIRHLHIRLYHEKR